jgi:multisubunit Na+/H+ antiporter MnhB subunit
VSGGAWTVLAFLMLALVLPVMALRDRQLDFSRGWRMAAIWVALFLLTVMAFTWLRP